MTQSYIIFEEVLDNDYTFKIINNAVLVNRFLDIYINNNKAYIVSYNPNNDYYVNFSVVSNKLNQSTE